MANAWLRLWHDMPNDPKWRTIARVSGQPIATVMAVYIHLLVSASRNVTTCHGVSLRGHIDVTTEDLASALDVTEDVIDSILHAMQGRVLDGDLISGWEKRQVLKEDNGNVSQTAKSPAERKRAQREREKLRKYDADCHDESRRVTHLSRQVTTDKDTDTELNPTHNARMRESAPTGESHGAPLQTAEPEYLDGLSEPIGKFSMTTVWQPSSDFRQRAAVWGMALPEPEFTPAELAAFRDYWMAEGKVFTQVQWEQKFARHVQHVRTQVKPVSKGVSHAASGGTASRAVQEIRAAREQWERDNGFISNGNGLEVVGAYGEVYSNRWTQKNGAAPSKLWIAQIGTMTEQQIRLVCRQCMDRCRAGETWPPDLAEFVALISESGANPFGLTVDAVMEEYRRWRNESWRYDGSDKYPWPQPVLYHICLEMRTRGIERQMTQGELKRLAERQLTKWAKHVGNGMSVPPVRRQLEGAKHPQGPTPIERLKQEYERRKAAGFI